MKEVKRDKPAAVDNLVDRLVGFVAPGLAVKRRRARAVLAITGGYKGGRKSKRNLQNWTVGGGSANSDTLPDLPTIRARSRDLRRNVPIAAGAANTTIANVVGDGLQLQSSVNHSMLGIDQDRAREIEEAIEREYSLFAASIDFTGVQHFSDMQATLLGSILESGDVALIRRFRNNAGAVYSTRLQMMEADLMSNPGRRADTSKLIAGVQLNADGRPIAYHFANRHPDDFSASAKKALKWRRVPARFRDGRPIVLHCFERQRPGQTRGVPFLATVIEQLKQFERYTDAEIDAAVINAFFALFIESPDAGGETSLVGENVPGEEDQIKLEAGAIHGLGPGEVANMVSPGRPNPNFAAFVEAFLQQIGVALDLPHELLVKHFTASYSASRAALEMAWQSFRRRRAGMARQICQPVYEMMLEEAVTLGRLDLDGFFDDPIIRAAWSRAEWIGPVRMSLDPLKEAKADEVDMGLGVKTRRQICTERTGGDWKAKAEQQGREMQVRKDAGLGAVVVQTKPPDPNSDDDDDDDEDDDK